MSVSFIRIDDRMIHGQTCTRWAREYPCDGLIAVNDKAAKNDVLKAAYKAASGKKTFVWTLEDFQKKAQKVLDSDTRYFLITKNPVDMCKILVDQGFQCGVDTVIVGPCNDREGPHCGSPAVHRFRRSAGLSRPDILWPYLFSGHSRNV